MRRDTDPCPERYMSVAQYAGPQLQMHPEPMTVPVEVDHAISVAWVACEALQTSGHRLHFTIDRTNGTVDAVLQDLQGNPLDTLSVSQVLRLAGGGSAQ
jgi:hypothetical protein